MPRSAIANILKAEFNALDAHRLRPHAEERAELASRRTHHGRASPDQVGGKLFETPAEPVLGPAKGRTRGRAPQDEDRRRKPKMGRATGDGRAGLTPMRWAFVVISEYNYDVLPLSYRYSPNAKTFGAFSPAFTEVVRDAFLDAMRRAKVRRVDRTGE